MINSFFKPQKLPIKRIVLSSIACVLVVSQTTFAIDSFYADNDIQFYDPKDTMACSTSNASLSSIGTDYKGRTILNDTQKQAIRENQSVYETAANEIDIPWQLLAVVHLRESGLGRENPANGQGIYQFVNKNGGPYPAGLVSEDEFLRQTKLAAQFLKDKAKSGNITVNKNLTKDSPPDTIKDTLFSYNGRAAAYATQAATIGFDSVTQPYEGSPYVMNNADEQRDPDVNKTTWGQITRDFGDITYPANHGYGAFVIYSALAGIASSSCSGSSVLGTVREKVLKIAAQELKLWQDKQLTGNNKDFEKYTHGKRDNWCAWFVSWVYNEAGYPLNNNPGGEVSAVATVKSIGEDNGKFEYHDKNNYTPIPGDITVYKNNGKSHVNIVTAVAPDGKVTIIGGNQGYGSGGGQATSWRNSLVTTHSFYVKDDAGLSGFVSPKE